MLSGEIIATATEAKTRRQLINRFFSVASLKSLRLNCRRGEACLEFAAQSHSVAEVLPALASAMRGRNPASLPLPHEEIILKEKAFSAFEIHRLGSGLTLWRVDTPSTWVYRLTHPLLGSDFVRKEVLNELGSIPDVVHQSFSVLLSGGNSLLVFVRPHRIEPSLFQEVLDPVLTRCLSTTKSRRQPKLSGLLVNTNLALAPIADFLFPPLGVVNFALTALISLKYIPRALLSLRKGKFTVELLYLTSAVFTVITFEFLPAAVIYWFMRFWPRRSEQLYDLHRSKFLARYRALPRRVWVERNGSSVETRVGDLSPSSILTLTAGDTVPGDGTILSGAAQFNEQVLTGESGDAAKNRGDPIYATSHVVNGVVRMKISSTGDDTAAGRIAFWHRETLKRQNSEHRAADLADRTTLPILLLGAAALVQGGMSMAKATIRPDYLTGPAISEKMSGLATVIRAANDGIMIAGNSSLEKLLKCNSIVLDDSVAWKTPGTEQETFATLAFNHGFAEVVFFSVGSDKHAAKEASRLGLDAFRWNSSAGSKRSYIQERQNQGRRVVYIGNCEIEGTVAEQADLAISVLAPPYRKQPKKASIALLSPDLMKFLKLRAIAASASNEFKIGFGLSLAPNLVAVFAALFLGSPTSVAVLLTNLGMLADYIRSGIILRQAEIAGPE